MAQSARQAKEIVQQLLDGIDEHDLEVFDELIAETVTTGIYRSGSDDPVAGREGMKELWREYWAAFPDLRGVSTDLIQEGDRVAIFRAEEGTHEGTFRGIEPTGSAITFEYSGYMDVEDGQVTHAYFHGDMLNLLAQLGVESPFPEP